MNSFEEDLDFLTTQAATRIQKEQNNPKQEENN